MAMKVMMMFERIRPKAMVMALPNTGRKAKKPIHAPRPARNRWALSRSFFFTWRYFSIHSILPNRPTQ